MTMTNYIEFEWDTIKVGIINYQKYVINPIR